MKVLFIWDQCNEAPLEFYEVTGDLASLTMRCEGQYVNSCGDTSAIDELHNLVFYDDAGNERPPRNDFAKLDHTLINGPWDRVVVAGFLP